MISLAQRVRYKCLGGYFCDATVTLRNDDGTIDIDVDARPDPVHLRQRPMWEGAAAECPKRSCVASTSEVAQQAEKPAASGADSR